ncbi:glycosyltransferase 87 family protein [Spongiimicrobium salis]|uniref:glycosyltransferase 87 family protein n=1 Tax=Spongiimicrobium salis TaxID=1667022 RepID=UPI00374CB8B8
MLSYWKLHKFPILLLLLSLVLYSTFAYSLDRTDFPTLLSLFVALFFLCYKLIQFEKWNFKFLLVAGILFRLVFLIVEPNLSQDFYRFIWDGELVSNGINPYLYVPDKLILQEDLVIANAQELYDGMGSLSARHFSNYPPLNQAIFALASLLSGKSVLGAVIVMRLLIILADIGILYFGRKLLSHLNRSTHNIFWYFVNPLVIIELTGNLHFEGVMLFFFVWSLYLLAKNKWLWAAVVYALSISVKLVPILFLPLFLTHFKFKKTVLFYSVIGGTILILLVPFFSSEFIDNYSQTIGLWFSNFEFNAGLYNAIKSIAVQFDGKPWILIKIYGKITPILTIIVALLLTFLRKNESLPVLLTSMLLMLTFYYFTSATVHPWYIIFLVVLGVFSEYRYALLWSFTVILSYWAYSNADYKENLWLLTIEYIAVYGFLAYEIFKLKGEKLIFNKNQASN